MRVLYVGHRFVAGRVARALAIPPSAIIFRPANEGRGDRRASEAPRLEEVRPQSGSCIRCRRSLDAASVKAGGQWYGNEACARGGPCPLDSRPPVVPEPWLYVRPQRFFRRRKPKELHGTDVVLPATYQESSESK
jgi:hypothetical protein